MFVNCVIPWRPSLTCCLVSFYFEATKNEHSGYMTCFASICGKKSRKILIVDCTSLSTRVWSSSCFFKKNQRVKGAELAEHFKRNKRARQLLGDICRLHVLFMSKGVQEN